jgi:hypothetical protein
MPGNPGATIVLSTLYRNVGGAMTVPQRVPRAYPSSDQSGLSSPTL